MSDLQVAVVGALRCLALAQAAKAKRDEMMGAAWRCLLAEYLAALPPHPRSHAGGVPTYPYEVVEHRPDNYVGICPETEDRIVLARDDLVIYELDWSLFLADVAAALGFRCRSGGQDGLPPATRLVGDYRPTAGYSFPAYLTVPLEARTLTSAVCMLVSTSDVAIILLTPTRHRLRPDAQQILERKKCCWLPLEEALQAAGPRQWHATDAAVQALRDFTNLHLPSPEADNGMVFFSIDGEPIVATDDGKGWQTVFSLGADA